MQRSGEKRRPLLDAARSERVELHARQAAGSTVALFDALVPRLLRGVEHAERQAILAGASGAADVVQTADHIPAV